MRSVEALVERRAGGMLALGFRLEGELSRLRIPPRRAPRVGTELWRHTCFEAFVALEDLAKYHELNFAPSGEWALYAFRAYRERDARTGEMPAPPIEVRASATRFELDTEVELGRLSPIYPRRVLRLGLSAVVEASDGTLSYWALDHAAATPDFHDRRSFVLRLEPPVAQC